MQHGNKTDLPEYTLSSTIADHNDQVRGVCSFPHVPNGIVTCSVDQTVKLWQELSESDLSAHMGPLESRYELVTTMVGHTNFVIEVAPIVLSDNSEARIVSVSHDKSIIVWNAQDGSIVLKQENAHDGAISCMTVTPTGAVVTGSWDKTAKVWSNDLKQCVHHLRGHEMNVLCVLGLPNGTDIVTGCGDGTIKIWRDGRELRTIRAHTTCVRGLTILPNVGFLSCANDGVVKLWSFEGNEMHSLQAHNTLCYAVVADPTSSSLFFTCSEDNTLKVWQDFQCVQTIAHPKTVWSVAVLANGDIVTACADHKARVFTKSSDRAASDEVIAAFKSDVTKAQKKTKNVNVDELPLVSVLTTEIGKRDGEVKVVNDGGVANAYQWDMRAQQWQLVGEVVGGPGVGENLVGKEELNGKFYDHVFDVELDDGRSYKLGFNDGDNPYEAAQEFINTNNLPQFHMETVAKFIIQNFGGDEASARAIAPQRVLDPWNMASSSASQRPSYQRQAKHFPCQYGALETANLGGIANKIKEFNSQVESNESLSEDELRTLESLIGQLQQPKGTRSLGQNHMAVLNKLLSWPPGKVFPVLDLVRIAVLVPSAANYFADQARAGERNVITTVTDIGFTNNESGNVILQMMALRLLGNSFQHESLRSVLVQSVDRLLDTVIPICEQPKDSKLIVPYSKLLQNLMIHFDDNAEDSKPIKQRVLGSAKSFLDANAGRLNAESLYALLCGIGTLIHRSERLKQLAKQLGVDALASRFVSHQDAKVSGAAVQLSALF